MDSVSPILDLVSRLWNCTANHASIITDIEETMNSLRMKTEELKAICNDVKAKLELEEKKGMKRTQQVQLWLKNVEKTENKVNKILQQDEQPTGDTSCLKKCHCWFSYKVGKKAVKTLNAVTYLINDRGNFQELAIQQPLSGSSRETEGLSMMPMENPLGIESDFMSVWEALQGDKVQKIGMYGMGGVGKTTLLKHINNELSNCRSYDFDVAIWVVASKKATEEAIQQAVLQKIRIPSEEWGDTMEDNAALIHQKLKGRKYILMLDDVWERLDLLSVGIPSPDKKNKSKIIFTTRSEDVCFRMKADWTIKVNCLSPEKALNLFLENAREAALTPHREIRRIAELMVEECKGLPLALITIGRAMAGRKTLSEWSHALQQLKKYPFEFLDLGKHVLSVLKFSYDKLADSTTQKCFVYCSLFPENYEIESNQLVDLWIGEGYLEEHDVKEARNHGFSIIEDLKHACLLESGINTFDISWVKMHDVIRDMALWIASDYGKHNSKFVILEDTELTRAKSDIQEWNAIVEKMSLWGNVNSYSTIVELVRNSVTCFCPQLSTLVVGLTRFERSLDLRFFEHVPNLRVLDLSARVFLECSRVYHTSPMALEVKGISELINLEYLNLSGLQIHKLPEEFKRLTKLRYLIMDGMHDLKECPTEILFHLTELLVFRMDSSPLYHEEFMRGLDNLDKLQEISIYVRSINSLEFFLKSEKLQKCTRSMKLENMDVNVLKLCPTDMKSLESLRIFESNFKTLQCNRTFMVFNDLHTVEIELCDSLEELDFLAYAPSIENLGVTCCKSLQRILCVVDKNLEEYDGDEPVFSCLKQLCLNDLPSLEIICNISLTYPTLELIEIRKCPKLQQNPFDDMMLLPTNSYLREIRVEKECWDSLKWRDGGRNQRNFSEYFKLHFV